MPVKDDKRKDLYDSLNNMMSIIVESTRNIADIVFTEYVNHKEFFEWLAEFVDKLHKMRRTYSTEDFLYMDKDKFTEKDIYNENYIADCIFDLFDEIGEQQGKEAIEDDSWSFPDTEWYFKFNNKIYFINEYILLVI